MPTKVYIVSFSDGEYTGEDFLYDREEALELKRACEEAGWTVSMREESLIKPQGEKL